MPIAATETDFVNLIAQEIAFGIDDAVGYWFGRIERQLARTGLSAEEKLRALAAILQEYKEATGRLPFRHVHA